QAAEQAQQPATGLFLQAAHAGHVDVLQLAALQERRHHAFVGAVWIGAAFAGCSGVCDCVHARPSAGPPTLAGRRGASPLETATGLSRWPPARYGTSASTATRPASPPAPSSC